MMRVNARSHHIGFPANRPDRTLNMMTKCFFPESNGWHAIPVVVSHIYESARKNCKAKIEFVCVCVTRQTLSGAGRPDLHPHTPSQG